MSSNVRRREPPAAETLSGGARKGAAWARVEGSWELPAGQSWADHGDAGMLQIAYPRHMVGIHGPAALVGWAAQAPDWEGRPGWRIVVAAVLPGVTFAQAKRVVRASASSWARLGESGRGPPTVVGILQSPSMKGGGHNDEERECLAPYVGGGTSSSLGAGLHSVFLSLDTSRRGSQSLPVPLSLCVSGKDVMPTSTQILVYGAPGPRGVCHHYERRQLRLSAVDRSVPRGPDGHGFVAWAVFFINAAPFLSCALANAERELNGVNASASGNVGGGLTWVLRTWWATCETTLAAFARRLVESARSPKSFLALLCRWSALARIIVVKMNFLVGSSHYSERISAEEEALLGVCASLGLVSRKVVVLQDTLCGLVVGHLLFKFSTPVELTMVKALEWVEHVGIRESIASFLQNPGGMKLNGPLNASYYRLVEYILAIATQEGKFVRLTRILLTLTSWRNVALWIGSVCGASGLLAAAADLVGFLTWPITTLHVIFSFILRGQLYAWAWCLRVFQGKKWNVIRQRYYEGHEVRIEQRVIGTILFVINSLLLPTTLVYHLHSVVLRFACYNITRALLGLAVFISMAPLFVVGALFLRGARAAPQGIAVFPVVLDNPRLRPSWGLILKQMFHITRDDAHPVGNTVDGFESNHGNREISVPNLDPTYLYLLSLCAPLDMILTPMWASLRAECGPGPFSVIGRALFGQAIPLSPCHV